MDKHGVELGNLLPHKPPSSFDQSAQPTTTGSERLHLNGRRCTRCGQCVDECGVCSCFDYDLGVNLLRLC